MANKQTGGTRLTGINPLAYMGVEPTSPPQLVRYAQAPTNRDFGFDLGTLWIVSSPFEIWMLVNKPQNVANWVVIYPQGGSGGAELFITDAGTVEPDINFQLGVDGGENINTAANGPNAFFINLNRTIQWPATTIGGTQGVIFLDTDRFIHNYSPSGNSGENTFVGIGSGNFALIGGSNTGIGEQTLKDITSGSANTGIGVSSLFSITTGSDNIGLGNIAGAELTAGDSNNICIGNAAIAGDSGITRIGTEGTQTEAHVAGIFGATVIGTVTPNTIINVDDEGQLGQLELTSSGATIAITQPSNGVINLEAIGGGGGGGNPFSFSYIQATDHVINSGATYNLGSSIILTQLFDVGNNLFPGNGVGGEAFFTAPVTGKYYFEWAAGLDQSGSGFSMSITTTIRSYIISALGGGMLHTIITNLSMGDTVRCSITNNTPGPKTLYGNITVPTTVLNGTRFSGFLIPEGASGGNFSQPFLGIQQVDTPSVTGTGETYLLGSQAPIVEQYDIGNNFNSGNGVGTECSFTTPVTGQYTFKISVFFDIGAEGPNNQLIGLNINGVPYYQASIKYGNPQGAGPEGFTEIYDVALAATNVVTFFIAQSRGAFGTKVLSTTAASGGFPSIPKVTRISGYRIA